MCSINFFFSCSNPNNENISLERHQVLSMADEKSKNLLFFSFLRSEVFFPVIESKLVALEFEDLAELGGSTEEDGHTPASSLAHLSR